MLQSAKRHRSLSTFSSTLLWSIKARVDSGQNLESLALKHQSRILEHSSNPVCGFSMIEQPELVRLCAVWPMENWLGSSFNQIQGRTTVRESYPHALEQGPLAEFRHVRFEQFTPRSVGRDSPSQAFLATSFARFPTILLEP